MTKAELAEQLYQTRELLKIIADYVELPPDLQADVLVCLEETHAVVHAG